MNSTTEQLIHESLPTKPKISEPITVVWQLCDHSCNTRANSFCSPENVGEQGYVDDHDFDDQLEQHPFPTMCPSCSEIRSNKEPKHRTNHHKINELDNTR